jgi:proteasome alpha subunit
LALLITGIDRHSARLFETDPSGALIEYKATAIGSGRPVAMEILEEKYDENMSVSEGMELAIYALSKTTEELKPENIDMAIVKDTGKLVEKITVFEIEKIVKKVYDKIKVENEEAEKKKATENIE